MDTLEINPLLNQSKARELVEAYRRSNTGSKAARDITEAPKDPDRHLAREEITMDTLDFFDDRNFRVTDRILKHWLKEQKKMAKTGPHRRYKCRDHRCVWHFKGDN